MGKNKKGVKDSSMMIPLSSDFILSRSISAAARSFSEGPESSGFTICIIIIYKFLKVI